MKLSLPKAAFDRARLALWADGLAAALAASLPWSTSGTSILAVLWLMALLPTLTIADIRREALSAAGGLPILLWTLGVIGTLWADVSLAERVAGLGSFHKLLVVPLLLAQFRRSENLNWVVNAFLIACAALLVVSFLLYFFPIHIRTGSLVMTPNERAVPVKDYISQSGMFLLCVAGLCHVALAAWAAGQRRRALALLLLALAFLGNIAFVATGRTALTVLPLLLILLGFRHFGWKGLIGGVLATGILLAALFASSQYLRERVMSFAHEVDVDRSSHSMSSAGQRLEFWRKSMTFIGQAPLVGHGTGSIKALFEKAAVGQSGAAALVAENPHQQTFAAAIQLGLLGATVLWAMWLSHLWLFRRGSAVAWFGLVVVIQNVVGSLFNSHLFDFTQGWTYVVGVGICGGAMLRERSADFGATGRPAG